MQFGVPVRLQHGGDKRAWQIHKKLHKRVAPQPLRCVSERLGRGAPMGVHRGHFRRWRMHWRREQRLLCRLLWKVLDYYRIELNYSVLY